ncbi:MAG: hypothetical protein KatS3mg051_0549 [Anaerolineae bacterium]|nr:MAG: hypothetical protein KatS3mg051_0549 [Anaerolineae bacterium]
MSAALEIRNLHVSVEGEPILKGVNLIVRQGEIHALMGPNGSGKSTLSYTIMGHPAYEVTAGQIIFDGVDLLELEPDERSRLGLFLAFQYPVAIPGVTVANFLRNAINARRRAENPADKGIPIPAFRKLLIEKMDMLKMDHEFAGRYLNDGFSGGEKKRAEILQMAVLEPKIAIMDETDSGLDIDALRIVSRRRQPALRPKPGRAGHHALSAYPELHQAAIRAHHDGRADRRKRRPRTGPAPGRARLRLAARRNRTAKEDSGQPSAFTAATCLALPPAKADADS